MKRSKKPTNQIMIKANIRSNFYTVEFALLSISPDWVELTNLRLAAIKNFEVGFCIRNHSFWHSPITFYKSPVGADLPSKILPKYEDWAFITLNPEEENTFPAVETGSGTHQFVITKDGIGHFKAHGRHMGEVIIDVIEPKKLQEIRCYKLFVPEQQIANFYNIMQQNLKIP